jgi:hypothetical protein
MRESDLLKLHGVGPKAGHILRETLAERGLSFAKEGEKQVHIDLRARGISGRLCVMLEM